MKRLINFIKQTMPFLLLLIYIYPIKIYFFPQISFSFLFLFFFLFIVFHKKSFASLLSNKNILIIFYVLLLMLIFNGLSFFINNNLDFTYSLLILKYMITVVLAIIIVLYFQEKNISEYDFIKFFVFASVLLSIFCLLEFFSPEIRQIFFNLFISTDNIHYDTSFRVKGFVSGGGAKLSFSLAIAIMFAHALFIKYGNFRYIIFSAIISFSVIYVGRTGMILALLSWILLFIVFLFNTKLKNLISLTMAVSLVIILSSYITFSKDETNIMRTHTFELFSNYQETGELKSRSSDAIINMYYIPKLKYFLFGSGVYSYDKIYNPSDVGYYKQLSSTGIFGSLIFYSLIFMIQLKIYKIFKKNINKYYLILILLSFWIVELKEPVMTQGYVARVLLILYIFSIVGSRKYIRINKLRM